MRLLAHLFLGAERGGFTSKDIQLAFDLANEVGINGVGGNWTGQSGGNGWKKGMVSKKLIGRGCDHAADRKP